MRRRDHYLYVLVPQNIAHFSSPSVTLTLMLPAPRMAEICSGYRNPHLTHRQRALVQPSRTFSPRQGPVSSDQGSAAAFYYPRAVNAEGFLFLPRLLVGGYWAGCPTRVGNWMCWMPSARPARGTGRWSLHEHVIGAKKLGDRGAFPLAGNQAYRVYGNRRRLVGPWQHNARILFGGQTDRGA